MSSSSELQRDREVQGYLQSWQIAQGSSLKVARNLDNIVASHPEAGGELPGHTPQASSDKALSAFAQLAVLRLNAQNVLISLIDASTQTVLAEATRNLSLGDLDGGAKNDLFLGTSVFSRSIGPCEHVLTETCTARNPDGEMYTTAGMIVPDCRLDPRFQMRPFVQADDGLRFYAGVPIFSRKGHKIGSYAVCSDEPRDGLSIDDLQFIQNVAQAVMEHLEWARDRVDRFKGERIVRGLACFIEGCSGDDPTCAKDDQATGPPVVRPPAISITSPRRPLLRRISSTKIDAGCPSPGGQQKRDRLTRMFFRAADTLRSSTLADGVVIFGATASNARQRCRGGKTNGLLSDEDDQSPHITSGSDGFGIDSSDSDASPAARPCKILSYSLADEKVHAEIEKGPALSLGTLEKYFSLFPKGKTFSFTDEGLGISSDDDSASDREPTAGSENPGERGKRRRGAKMDHKELLKKIPGAKSVVFLPLFDHVEDKLAGGCFLWTSVTGQMMNLDQDLSYLRAFGNSVMSEVGRINTQKNEAAKTTFIASMSHELRSPLHGILGAAEFLKDTITDSYQAGLVNSILTCGKTLLDTLNHVLDYSKINTLGRSQMRRGGKHSRLISLSSGSLESLNMSAAVDLSVLVEEVVNAIATGHTFKRLPGIYSPTAEEPMLADPQTLKHLHPSDDNGSPVSVLLDICPRTSWMVSTQPGALRRVIMNLFGNALKYTSSGFILVSLRGQETAEKSKIDVVIKVMDTGKGMPEEFQQNRLFVPFSQEDSFQPGTGLGLSIVKQIVDSLKGTLEVKSQQHKGTEVDVRLRLIPAPPNSSRNQDETVRGIVDKTRGRRLVLLGSGERNLSPAMTLQIRMRNETLIETCTNWFEMEVVKEEDADVDASKADIYLYCEPPSIQTLKDRFQSPNSIPSRNRKIPIVIVCAGEEEAAQIARTQTKALAELSKLIEVVPQPCGPRKLAQVFKRCLQSIEEIAESESAQDNLTSPPEQPPINGIKVGTVEAAPVESTPDDEEDLTPVPSETILPLPSPTPLDPETPLLAEDGGQLEQNDEKQDTESTTTHVLLVDDNKINLQLLVMFMKKCKFTYEEAENGQEALDKFTSRNLSSKKRFDYILMDISMPVMNGIEATKRIRQVERENQIQPTTVLALTGLASADARRDVLSAGVDVFLPKPVRFAELKKLLTEG
ncbi:hypothetical protein NW755_006145 [Fusarium falciforme]|uniref:Histidine kinase n=1 Tax=Fusarium falciforme TaxID=195108 RepID=A0A9W8R9M5_9HYPO|nr:hypothetical protein NW755_006145 [Fusarium falciforme]